ncbi:MAG: hypothetical protein QOE11_2322, partial [Solirubrobacteraceae bacterium]|nr:hypothetical protein [Solirubrobacteraceae bacterium]
MKLSYRILLTFTVLLAVAVTVP